MSAEHGPDIKQRSGMSTGRDIKQRSGMSTGRDIKQRSGMAVGSMGSDDVGGELLASALLMLFALCSTGLLLGTALGAVWLLG
jgi:hypothetical protein